MKRFIVPLLVFGGLSGVLAASLSHDPRRLPSALIGAPAPAFTLPRLDDATRSLSPQSLRGRVWMMNVWASWCASCRDEHALLLALSRGNPAPVVGLNYKDEPDAARQWLQQAGDPYSASVSDRSGDVGIDYGVYGVPETFVVDRRGVVRYRRAGPMTQAELDTHVLPLIKRLQNEAADE